MSQDPEPGKEVEQHDAKDGEHGIRLDFASLDFPQDKPTKSGQMRCQIHKTVDHDRIEFAADEGRNLRD
jgi:hypothetical protein